MLLYDQVVDQVKQLNEVRKGEDKAENRCKIEDITQHSHDRIC